MKKLKGFTLLELVIVMAIFSIIMYSAVQLLQPVSKFFVRSSNFENTTACMDNMRRCIEGNLKYADRVRAYNGFKPYDYSADFQSVTVTNDLIDKVKSFYREFFEDRRFIDTGGTINVLVFDNTEIVPDADLAGLSKLSDYTSKQVNQGKLVLIQFPFDNYGGTGVATDAASLAANMQTPILWSVNQKLYGNFDYRFSLDAVSDTIVSANTDPLVTTAAGETTTAPLVITETDTNGSVIGSRLFADTSNSFFNPRDFNIQIACREIRRSGGGLVRQTPTSANVASFSMKNVMNASDGYRTAALDYVTVLGNSGDDESGEHDYRADRAVPRYKNFEDGTGFDGFYFIFTLPEEIHDVADRADYNDGMLLSQRNLLSATS
ncbi:MAG: prepilin-type N-terminal cleavage/methylation domain-containing protein [Oscillospiraceae bacterium]|nr:prepilin-type N-terminal cleavage/methylation domain-containing protein [Oscillospiraceae bacterium]